MLSTLLWSSNLESPGARQCLIDLLGLSRLSLSTYFASIVISVDSPWQSFSWIPVTKMVAMLTATNLYPFCSCFIISCFDQFSVSFTLVTSYLKEAWVQISKYSAEQHEILIPLEE